MPEITLIDGASSFAPEQSINTFQVNPSPAPVSSGVITQGRTASGSPITGSSLNANSVINIGGVETTVRAAMAAGYVQQNPDGTFSMVSQEARSQAQQQREQARAQAEAEALGIDGEVETVDQTTEATITTFANSVSPSTVMGAIVDLSSGQEVREGYISQAASQMGVEPEQVRAMVEQVRGAFEAQARSTVEHNGLSADEVFAWAHQHKPELMRQAIHQQATMRTTKGYQRLAHAYLENLDAHDPEALLNAELGEGLEIKKAANGKVYLKTPMGEMEYRAAVRAGLLKFSRSGGRR